MSANWLHAKGTLKLDSVKGNKKLDYQSMQSADKIAHCMKAQFSIESQLSG